MDLKRKLERLRSAGPGGAAFRIAPAPVPPATPAGDEGDERTERLRRMLGQLGARRAPPAGEGGEGTQEPARGLPAAPRMTGHGMLHVAERLLPPSHRHGRVPVGEAASVDPALVAALALQPALAGVDFRRMLLLDTETTGLSVGAGTLPFLIGLGWFEGDSLQLQQLFLRRPGEEAPMLRALAERLEAASCLVTYNGKTYDWPLLRTRFVMNRLAPPALPPHLDLLHCARRVFRHRLEGARLVHIEERVLGHQRVDDVDGALIPDLYFRFLRTGDGRPLEPVLEHNAFDLMLLAALLAALVDGFRAGASRGHPGDHLGFACVAERAQDFNRAFEFATAAATAGEGAVAVHALLLKARLARKAGNAREAVDALSRALALAGPDQAASIHLALSKLYEHALHDFPLALHHARHTAPAEGPDTHRRRMSRLEARLQRARPVTARAF